MRAERPASSVWRPDSFPFSGTNSLIARHPDSAFPSSPARVGLPAGLLRRPSSCQEPLMQIRYGYRIELVSQQELPLLTMLDVHPSRQHDVIRQDDMTAVSLVDPRRHVPVERYRDPFGNICRRLVAPAGGIRLSSAGLLHDSGEPDPFNPAARQAQPSELPDEVLIYLLGSRYCETDK